jgi:hydroxysqualene dehydroxylase
VGGNAAASRELTSVTTEVKDVVIIGGGFAGLSAGVALAEAGLRVALIEGKPALGGRAYSFVDHQTGDLVDNGQHVLMGCYKETLDFLGKIGTRDKLIVHRNLEIDMLDGPRRRAVLRCAALPGPLHMTAAVVRYAHLTIGERMRVIVGGLRLMLLRRFDRERLARMTVADLMDVLGQGEQARRCFWSPIAIATLNEDPALASAELFAEVLKRAFFSRRSDSAFVYSRVGLSELYCDAARDFIERRAGTVQCRAIAEAVEFGSDGSVSGVRLREGGRVQAASVIAAVPPPQLLKLMPEGAISDPYFSRIASLRSSPIICVHVWLDREVTSAAFAGFIGTPTQWLFNKRRIFERHGENHPGYLSFVISGARVLVDRSSEELLEIVMNDLRRMIPAAREARVLKSIVLKEKHATMAPDPQSVGNRPSTATPIRNLFLAGDWVKTPLPATIESAVTAGRAAAAAVRARAAA